MDQRTAWALARVKAAIKAGRRPVTAVEVRCDRRGHIRLSAHPVGAEEFLVWRRPARATGRVRDGEEWQRDGWATPGLDQAGFAPLPEHALIVSGADADSARELLGLDSTVIGCACGLIPVGPVLADDIHAALTEWQSAQSRAGSRRPIVVIAA